MRQREAIHILLDILEFINSGKVEGVGSKTVTRTDLINKLHSEIACRRWIDETLLRYGFIRKFKSISAKEREVTVYTKTLRGEHLLEILKIRNFLVLLCFTRGKRLRRECTWAK